MGFQELLINVTLNVYNVLYLFTNQLYVFGKQILTNVLTFPLWGVYYSQDNEQS